ncbi:MAG: hypothetical protein ACR2LX_01165 [Jatrophihabitans sp.]
MSDASGASQTESSEPRPLPGPRPPTQPPLVGPSQTGERPQSFGWLGAIAIIVGAVLLLVAFFGVEWFDAAGTNDFAHLRSGVGDNVSAAIIAKLYFGGLAWILAAVGFVLALLACVPSAASLGLRVFGAVAGFGGVALTLLSVRLYTSPAVATYGFFLERVKSGFYVAALGFLLVGVGAMIGPRRGGDPRT